MRLDKLWWYPHWVFCIFRKNTNMPSTPHSGLTSMCRGIEINCLCKAEAFWWYTAWLSEASSTGAAVFMGKPKTSPETRLSAQVLLSVSELGRLECKSKWLTKQG
jgi:hypothetical protein